MYVFICIFNDVKVKLSKCPPSIRGNAPLGAQFSQGLWEMFIFNNYSSMNEIFDLMDGIWYIWSLLKSGEFSENNAV